MADETIDVQLRDMAQHRGLKLIKSRRRKPGIGDFGKFGLTDAKGKALLGIGKEGLTASAEDIQSYLRTDVMGSWKQSAETTPDRTPPPRAQPSAPVVTDDDPPLRRRRSLTADRRVSAHRARPYKTADEHDADERPKPTPHRRTAADPPKSESKFASLAADLPEPKPDPAPQHESERAPAPELVFRAAKASDATALAALLGQLDGIDVTAATVAANLTMARKTGFGVAVAELGVLVGCCGWAVIPTVHRGSLGRLTVLIVDEDHRRRGIATSLLALAESDLKKAGCIQVEAMSAIAIKNAHNFFRSRKFEQVSYRFVRALE